MRVYTNQNIKTYKQQHKIALTGLFAEASNLFFVVLNLIRTRSVLVMSDLVECTSATIHSLIVTIIAGKMKNDISDEYNYGVKRLEVFASFVCDVLFIVGISIVFVVSVINLFNPKPIAESMYLYVILKGFNTFFDSLFVFQEYRVYKNSKTAITKTELDYYIYCMSVDALYMFIGLISFIFRNTLFISYSNTILTIIFVLYFAYRCLKRLKSSFNELSDHSISIKGQDELFDIVLDNSDDIKKINYVNCHILNNTLHIDINLEFKTNVTYKKQIELLEVIDNKVKEKYQNSVTNFVIGKE